MQLSAPNTFPSKCFSNLKTLKTSFSVILFVCLLSLFPSKASSDMLFFTGGKVLHGEIVSEFNNLITVDLMMGGRLIMPVTMPRDIRRESKIDYLIKKADYKASRDLDAQAMALYLKALSLAPGEGRVQTRIRNLRTRKLMEEIKSKIKFGDKLVIEGEYRKAIAFFKTLLQQDISAALTRSILTKIAHAHAMIAYVFYDHVFEEWALQEITKAEEYNPQVPMVHYVLGRIHQDRNQFILAEKEFKRSLDLDPSFKDAEDRLTEIKRFVNPF